MEDDVMSYINLDGFFGDLPEAGDVIGACSSTNASSSSPDSGLSWFDEIENILMKDDEDGGVVGGRIRADSSQAFCDRFLHFPGSSPNPLRVRVAAERSIWRAKAKVGIPEFYGRVLAEGSKPMLPSSSLRLATSTEVRTWHYSIFALHMTLRLFPTDRHATSLSLSLSSLFPTSEPPRHPSDSGSGPDSSVPCSCSPLTSLSALPLFMANQRVTGEPPCPPTDSKSGTGLSKCINRLWWSGSFIYCCKANQRLLDWKDLESGAFARSSGSFEE